MRVLFRMKRRVLAVLMFSCLCVFSGASAVRADDQYVYDNARILDESESAKLEDGCRSFEEKTKSHMVILTEYSSGTKESQEIADDFFDKKYPNEKDENGICLLIDMGQRQIVISTSGIMRYYLSDREIDDILDSASEYAADGDYAKAFETMISMSLESYDRGVSEGDYLVDENGKIIHYRTLSVWEFLFSAICGVIAALAVYSGIRSSYRKKKNTGARNYARLGDVKIREQRDALIDRHIITRKIPKNPPPGNDGGHSGGGGSSVHTASSGRSHGGGSRGF
ncbi:MAG: TPM domain-containing protein [Fusicatenibacter sp.]|nr:TPM domain-containing protein [Fusicatenibacter sp.]